MILNYLEKILKNSILLTFIFFLTAVKANSQTIKGTIKGQDGERLSYASIHIKDSEFGTMSNDAADFEFSIEPGNYTLVFQYLGYEKLEKSISIKKDETKDFDIVMKPSVILLDEAKIKSSGEDPAVSIMRKTIAMANIHHNELKSFSLRAYGRTSFTVKKVPIFFKKQLNNELNLKLGQTYLVEGVSEFNYIKPKKITEKIIGLKSNLPRNLTKELDQYHYYINVYSPDFSHSPVTVSGSKNYTYRYLGFFYDKEKTIYKIQVIPKNESYYSGTINIVDGTWYVHSLELNENNGFSQNNWKMIFREVQDIWFPIQIDQKVKIKAMGFAGEATMATSVKNLKINKDPKYKNFKPEILDENVIKEEGRELNSKKKTVLELAGEETLTLSQIRKINKALKKAEYQESEEILEESDEKFRIHEVDSSAKKRDEKFWDTERQVPLSPTDIKNIQSGDSLNYAMKDKIDKQIKDDSLKVLEKKEFHIGDLIFGNTYAFGQKQNFKGDFYYKNNFQIISGFANTRFNPVEAFNLAFLGFNYTRKFDYFKNISFKYLPQYSTGIKKLNGMGQIKYSSKNFSISGEVGRLVNQINSEVPYSDANVTFFALVFNDNRGIFFGKKYAQIDLDYRINSKVTIGTSYEIATRKTLENTILKSPFYKNAERNFTPNIIENFAGINSNFETHQYSSWNVSLTYRPFYWLIKEGLGTYYQGPTFELTHSLNNAQGNFNRIQLTTHWNFKLNQAKINLASKIGVFYNKKPSLLIDYYHFSSSPYMFVAPDRIRDFNRFYYSTNSNYFTVVGLVKPQKLLFSQIKLFQKYLIGDYFIGTVLRRPEITHFEVGYGIGLFNQAVGIEFIGIFQNSKFEGTKLKIMVSNILNRD